MAFVKLLVVIPAHNEADSIERVITELTSVCPDVDFIVANDGSRDATARICRERGFPLLDLPINLGLSGAVQAGMKYASVHGYDAVLQFDGDGQHDPQFIPALSAAMGDTHADIVIGSRFLDAKKGRGFRMLGSRILSFLIRLTARAKVTDPTSGMRMFSRRVIDAFAWNINYGPEPDTVTYLIRSGARTCEVPVTMRDRQAGVSYLNPLRSISYMLEMCVSIVIIQWFRNRKIAL